MWVPLQDHDVQEDKILLVSLLMAEMGIHSVAYAFPQVKIITTAVDKKVNDLFHIIPGIGELWKQENVHIDGLLPCEFFGFFFTGFTGFNLFLRFCCFRELWRSLLWN